MDVYNSDTYIRGLEFDRGVNNELLDEIKALRKENGLLREFRDKKDAYDRELAQVKEQCDIKIRNAEVEANNKRFRDFLQCSSAVYYEAYFDLIRLPKCNKCDDNRLIHFISPAGRKMTERCDCDICMPYYIPNEVRLVEFEASHDSDHYSLYYKKTYDTLCDYYKEVKVYNRDELTPYIQLNRTYTAFLSKEECQMYCDWLNEQERKGPRNLEFIRRTTKADEACIEWPS